jgi:hypothetical protein
MARKRLLVHTAFLFALPLIVAWFGLSLAGAAALLVFALIWRWAISLSILVAPEKTPDLELETISVSHYVEKVRWCMDRLGVNYQEKPVGGTPGAFFLGGDNPNFTDFAFASIMGAWLQPPGYGGGKADAVRIDSGRRPAAMAQDIEIWSSSYPLATRFIEQLYRQERL